MSHEEDYSTTIDEQLLSAVKNDVHDDLGGKDKFSPTHDDDDDKFHDAHEHAEIDQQRADHHVDSLPSQRAADAEEARVHAQAMFHHQQHLHDVGESEYNIQIPEPIVDARLKIYPVNENTITHEGNLITRPFPEQLFHGREELNEFIAEFARDNGFGIVIAHSNRKAIYYTCELGGRYRHKKGKLFEEQEMEAARQRLAAEGGAFGLDSQARLKKLRCPFSMTALFRKLTLIWLLRTTCNEHNHPQLDPLLNHPMLRKRLDELNLLILDLYKVGTKPLHIEQKIKHQYPDVIIKREDIYNEIRGYKRKMKKVQKFYPDGVTIAHHKKRHTAASYQEVMPGDDDDEHDEVLGYELERHRHEAMHGLSHGHHGLGHGLDDLQLLHYQQQLHAHGLGDAEHSENTAAAAIAAVASAAGDNGELTIGGIGDD